MSKKKMLLVVIFISTMIGIKYLRFDTVPLVVKILVLLIAPIFLIWISSKYSKPGKLKKYRIIAFSSAGVWFYIISLVSLLDKYYPEISQKYHPILKIIILICFFASCIIIIVFSIMVKLNEDEDFSRRY